MWTLPNILTLFRAVAVVPVCVLLAAGQAQAAFLLFAIAAVTDFFDGWLARKWGQTSEFGRFLDPIADKLMVGGVLMMLGVVVAAISPVEREVWPTLYLASAVAIILRELLVSGLREFLGPKGVVVPVSKLAKWKTTAQLVGLGVILFGFAIWPHMPNFSEIATRTIMAGVALTAAAALLAWVTAWSYLRAGLRHMGGG